MSSFVKQTESGGILINSDLSLLGEKNDIVIDGFHLMQSQDFNLTSILIILLT